jgi:4-amino-4-deoxy-L-arabinose transferase-like glycosyltransferase
VVLALVATDFAARSCGPALPCEGRGRSRLAASVWWLLAGLCAGLAGAAKLNGVFVGGGLLWSLGSPRGLVPERPQLFGSVPLAPSESSWEGP